MKYKTSVMWKIYVIWAFRQVFNLTSAKLAAVALLVWQLSTYVSFGQVIRNMPSLSDWNASYAFIESAFVNTEVTTQIIILGIIAVGALFALDIRRNLAHRHASTLNM